MRGPLKRIPNKIPISISSCIQTLFLHLFVFSCLIFMFQVDSINNQKGRQLCVVNSVNRKSVTLNLFYYLFSRIFFFFFYHQDLFFRRKLYGKFKVALKLNIQKTKIMASGPITSWEIDGETVETVSDFILGAPKSLQMVTVAMKLKDTYSLEEKL